LRSTKLRTDFHLCIFSVFYNSRTREHFRKLVKAHSRTDTVFSSPQLRNEYDDDNDDDDDYEPMEQFVTRYSRRMVGERLQASSC